MRVLFSSLLLPMGLVLVLNSSSVMAQTPETHWQIYAGVYAAQVKSAFGLEGQLLSTGAINIEKDLNMADRVALPVFGIQYDISAKHHLRYNYLDLSRSGQTRLSYTIVTPGKFIPDITIGTDVDSYFDTKLHQLAYAYDFIDVEHWQLQGIVGLHLANISLGVNALNDVASFDYSFNAPLPNIGLEVKARISSKWTNYVRTQVFYLSYKENEGQLANLSLGSEFAFTPRWSAGLSYDYYHYFVDTVYLGPRLVAQYDFHGLTLIGRFRF